MLRTGSLRDEVNGLIAVLDSREKKIISSRFGLDGGKPRRWKTLVKVSALRGNDSPIAEHCNWQSSARAQ